MYARTRVLPKLHDLDEEKLSNLFVDLRRESKESGSFPITVRHLESTLRLAEASAKMHLREFVRADDVNLAIKVVIGSFVSAQKTSIKKSLERVSEITRVLFGDLRETRRVSANTSHKHAIMKNCSPSFWASSSRRKFGFTNYNIMSSRRKFRCKFQN